MWNAVPIQVSIDSMKFNNRAHSIGTLNLLIFYIIVSNKKLNISVICFSHNFTEVNYFKYLVSLCVGEKITRDTESRKIFFFFLSPFACFSKQRLHKMYAICQL